MGKLLFVLLIAAIAWAFFKKHQGSKRSSTDKPAGSGKAASPTEGSAASSSERMVACGACGVFMPESDSVLTSGKIGCRDPAQCAHRPS